MYRINLYPEYGHSRKAARSRTASTAILFTLLGVEVLMVGALLLSDSLLRERADALRAELPHLEERLAKETQDQPELRWALDMLEVRAVRIDWSTKLNCLAEHIGESLMLQELDGRGDSKRERPSLTISGHYRQKNTNLSSVSGYLDRLRGDPRISDDFPSISLGNIRSDRKGEFDLLCAPGGEPE